MSLKALALGALVTLGSAQVDPAGAAGAAASNGRVAVGGGGGGNPGAISGIANVGIPVYTSPGGQVGVGVGVSVIAGNGMKPSYGAGVGFSIKF